MQHFIRIERFATNDIVKWMNESLEIRRLIKLDLVSIQFKRLHDKRIFN